LNEFYECLLKHVDVDQNLQVIVVDDTIIIRNDFVFLGSRTRQAFEDDENNDQLNAQETNEESNTTSNTALSNNPSNDQLPIYEQALFTINNLTVEVTLDHDILTWKTVPNGSN